MDGYDVRKLLQLLKRECGLTDSQIDDVKVLDSFSFVTVPFSEAKEAIRRLNDISNGGRPIAEIAQDGQGRGARGAYKKEGFKKDYKGKRDSAGYAKGSSYGAGSRKDSGEGWKAGATRGAKPAPGERGMHKRLYTLRALPKRKRERTGRTILPNFLPGRNKAVGAARAASTKKPLPARIKNAETVNCFSEAGFFPIAITCFPMTGSVRFS